MKLRKVEKKSAMMLRRHGLCFSTTAPGTSNTVPGSQQHVGMKPEEHRDTSSKPGRTRKHQRALVDKRALQIVILPFRMYTIVGHGPGRCPLNLAPVHSLPFFVVRQKRKTATGTKIEQYKRSRFAPLCSTHYTTFQGKAGPRQVSSPC